MKARYDLHVMSGCRGVLAATLLTALTDVREANGYAENAMRWISSGRSDHIFAFVRVCETLNLDPAAVRKASRRGDSSRHFWRRDL
jgi:hypothetical protein